MGKWVQMCVEHSHGQVWLPEVMNGLSREECSSFALELFEEISSTTEFNEEEGISCLSVLVRCAFASRNPYNKCLEVYDSFLEKLMTLNAEEESSHLVNPFEIVNLNSNLDLELLKKCYVYSIEKFVTETGNTARCSKPLDCLNLFVSNDVENGIKKSPSFVEGIVTEFFIPFSTHEIEVVLRRILEKEKSEINWKNFFTLISLVLVCFVGEEEDEEENSATSDNFLWEITTDLLMESISNENLDEFAIALCLARTASSRKSRNFPSYSEWFRKHLSISITSRSKAFCTLIQFLTLLVPLENASILKSYLSQQPNFPTLAIKAKWRDFCSLARTRISDLEQEQGTSKISEHPAKKIDSQVIREVENEVLRDLKEFGLTGKVPPSVMKCCIFRKTHFTHFYVPTLLALDCSEENPANFATRNEVNSNNFCNEATKSEFIQELVRRGKIPSQLKNKELNLKK